MGRKIGTKNHGMSKTLTYSSWIAMKSRCLDKDVSSYKYCGAKGITFDPSWRDFFKFLKDMGERPSRAHSLDRINNSAGYSKDNCRWATSEEQNNNTTRSRHYFFNGKKLSVSQIARVVGIPEDTLRYRLGKMKLPIEEAVSKKLFWKTKGVSK